MDGAGAFEDGCWEPAVWPVTAKTTENAATQPTTTSPFLTVHSCPGDEGPHQPRDIIAEELPFLMPRIVTATTDEEGRKVVVKNPSGFMIHASRQPTRDA
jgi:hypothetical protein